MKNSKTDDICIVIQGASTNVEEQKIVWKDFKNQIIFSTWKGEERKYEKSDNVIFSDIPAHRGTSNLNLQKISTLCGVERAKELGYKRVLKMRSDQVPTNPHKFLNEFSEEKITVFLRHLHGDEPYYADYFMCGKIDVMHEIWQLDALQNCAYSEWAITKKIKSVCSCVEFYKNKINKDNNVISFKWGINLYDEWKDNQSWFYDEEEC